MAIVLLVAKGPLVGPDGRRGRSTGLSITGINDIDVLNFSVAVPVVIGEVHLVIYQQTSLGHHFTRSDITATLTTKVLTVVFHFLGYGDGSCDVEFNVELPVALVAEVFTDASVVLAVRITYGVEFLIENSV